MAIFALKSLAQSGALEDAEADRRASVRVEQFRVSEQAIYFPAFPGDQYLPFTALSRVMTRSKALPVTGTCGKAIPMVCLRAYYDGEEFYKDFLFEKQASADKVLDRIRACCPALEIDRKVCAVVV